LGYAGTFPILTTLLYIYRATHTQHTHTNPHSFRSPCGWLLYMHIPLLIAVYWLHLHPSCILLACSFDPLIEYLILITNIWFPTSVIVVVASLAAGFKNAWHKNSGKKNREKVQWQSNKMFFPYLIKFLSLN